MFTTIELIEFELTWEQDIVEPAQSLLDQPSDISLLFNDSLLQSLDLAVVDKLDLL